MAGFRIFCVSVVFLADFADSARTWQFLFKSIRTRVSGFIGQAIAQCDGAAKLIKGGTGEIQSPNINTGGEYNKSANCTWGFKPPSDGREYALVITVKRLKLYVLKGGRKHCLGSYNLAINNGKTSCDRYVHRSIFDISGVVPANYFCKSYYSSPACVNVNETQGCETRQQTSYPVTLRYDSDGRTYEGASSTSMYFGILYEFIACPKEESAPASSTSQRSKSLHSTTSAPKQAATSQESATSASDKEHSTTPETGSFGTSPVPTSTIILSVVVAILVLIIIAGGVFIWTRILPKKPQTTNKTRQQESPDGIYDNDPSPSNQKNRAYKEITEKSEYEIVKSANVEEDPYTTPNPTPTGGEYEVPIPIHRAPRQYENVA